MSAPWRRFTFEQTRAALLVDRPMLAAAGAGAGKTAVMAVRYCAALLDRSPDGDLLLPDRVLALAFTREAAANLRARIDRTLRQALGLGRFPRHVDGAVAEEDLAPALVDHLRRCLDALPSAPITTFDGWCLQAVAEHAADLGRDPELAPPDDLTWESCRERAWRRLRAAELAQRGDELPMLCEAYGEPAVQAAIERLGDQASALPAPQVEAAVDDPVAALMALRRPQLDGLRAALADAQRLAQGQDSRTARDLLAIPAAPEATLASLIDWLTALDQLGARGQGLKEAIQEIQDLLDAPHARDGKGARPAKTTRCGRAGLLALLAYQPELEETLQARARACARLAKAWLALLGDEAERAGIAGFARIEAEALALLEQPAARGRLGRRYRHVLLDEAQDLNRLQGRIVELLQQGGAATGSARVFAVGDHRQSIFGFRHAAPEIFGRWEADIVGRGGGSAQLAENFRTHPELLAEVRKVFAQPPLAGPFAPERVRAGREADERPALLQCWRAEPTVGGAPATFRRGSFAGSQAQARLCARLIADGIAAGRRPGEHAILLRARSRMRAYAAALEQAGVPYDTDFPAGLYDSQECHDLEAILRLSLGAHDRVALAIAFAGPWGVADPQDRVAMAQALALDPAAAWAAAAETTRLHAVVADTRVRLAAEGPGPALRALAADPALAAKYGELPLARRRLANLVALADEADSGPEALDAAGIVARFAERRRLGVDRAEASGEEVGGRGVRLMTIHGAKGLEWPVVFLPDTDRRFELRDLRSCVLAQAGEQGLSLACRDPDAGGGLRASLAQEALHRRGLAEEARLFYVACTRATHELHCLAAGDLPDPPALDGSATCPAQWLRGAGMTWSDETVALDQDDPPPAAPTAGADALPELRAATATHVRVRGVTAGVDAMAAAGIAGVASALNRDLGIALHAALARWGPGMPRAQADSAVAPFRGQVPDERLDRLAETLADRALVPGYWSAAVRLVEQPVVGAEDGAVVLGICDVLLKSDDGRWSLFDYKSGGQGSTAGAEQLRAYARLLAPALGAPLAGAWLVDLERGALEAVALGG